MFHRFHMFLYPSSFYNFLVLSSILFTVTRGVNNTLRGSAPTFSYSPSLNTTSISFYFPLSLPTTTHTISFSLSDFSGMVYSFRPVFIINFYLPHRWLVFHRLLSFTTSFSKFSFGFPRCLVTLSQIVFYSTFPFPPFSLFPCSICSHLACFLAPFAPI